MQYVPKKGWQPVCVGVENGELVWKLEIKQPWHQKMFPVQYTGDFSTQWMYKVLYERGYDYAE